jgi:hypothetical protein
VRGRSIQMFQPRAVPPAPVSTMAATIDPPSTSDFPASI